MKAGAGLAAAGILTGLYSWQIEPYWLEFTHHPMRIKNLPSGLKGKKVMQISDIHVSDRFDRQYLKDALKSAQGYKPDIVVYTGDFISYSDERQFDQLAEVMQLAPKPKIGAYAVLGNHDYGVGYRQQGVADRVTEVLHEKDIQVLSNEKTNCEGLNIIGIDDYWSINFDPEPVMKSVKNSDANLVLCHNPDVLDLDIWHGYDSWVLSGHTHGGQCKPPFLPPPVLPVKNTDYTAGQFDFDDGRTLYINRALGHLWPLRFNVRPEITIFTLS